MTNPRILGPAAVLILALLMPSLATAAELLPNTQVNGSTLMDDVFFATEDEEDLTMGWWMPGQVFVMAWMMEPTTPPEEVAELNALVEGKLVLMMAHSKITALASVRPAERASTLERLKVTSIKADGSRHELVLAEQISAELTGYFNLLRPVFSNSFGKVGEAMDFFVYNNVAADGSPLVDPSLDELIRIDIAAGDGFKQFEFEASTQCNSLFKPRTCSTGEPAHVSWKFDPWTGKKLPE